MRREIRPNTTKEDRPLRTLASFISTSLDGFYEGPNGESDWPIVDQEFNDFAARQVDEADVLAFGRAAYEPMAAHWPTEKARANDPAMTARMNNKEKVVFSTTLADVNWTGTTLVHGEATEQMPNVMSDVGKERLVIGSAHLTANLAQAGILDELRIMICPIVLGQGRSLFEDLKNRVSLSLIRVRQFDSGNLVLTLPTVAPPELSGIERRRRANQRRSFEPWLSFTRHLTRSPRRFDLS